jgi:hypothetical protein
MNPVLTVPSPPTHAEPAEDHRGTSEAADRALEQLRAVDYGWIFWVCAPGEEGSARTTSVWGLWLDGAVAFAADTESVAAGDQREFPASVVQAQGDGRITIVDGSAERVEDAATLARFARACQAKYGFELDVDDPDTPVFVLRPHADLGWEADDVAETLAEQSIEPVG